MKHYRSLPTAVYRAEQRLEVVTAAWGRDEDTTLADIARDEGRLVRALFKAGAIVKVAALPPAADGTGRGPDDFIAVEGPKAFWAVLAQASAADPVDRADDVAAPKDPKATAKLVDDLPFVVSVVEAPQGRQGLVDHPQGRGQHHLRGPALGQL